MTNSHTSRTRTVAPIGAAAIVAIALLTSPQSAWARCGDAPGDAQAIGAARARIEQECDCSDTAKRSDYVRCARNVIKQQVAAGALPSSCRTSVQRCANNSTCGKPGAVTCCVTSRSGKTSCRVKRSASECRAPSGGRACVGFYKSCCDACDSGGCAPLPLPDPPQFCEEQIGLPALARVPFTTTAGSTFCGGPGLQPPPAPPLSGRLEDASGANVGDLGAGCMYAGALPGLALPPGGTAMLDVVGLTLPSAILGGSEGDGPTNCTKGAGPDRRCLNGAPGEDGQGLCDSDGDCGGKLGACALEARCFFGPPVPVVSNGLGVCTVNAFLTDLCGEVNLLTQQTRMSTTVGARVYLTGNPTEPCPRCVEGACTSGKRAGQACTPVSPEGTTNDCPPRDSDFLGSLVVPLPELTTGTSTLDSDSGGRFCGGGASGAFGVTSARRVVEVGQGPGQGGDPTGMRLAGAFCIPRAGGLLDTFAGLPGPVGISAGGTLDLTGLLPLP